jgi:acyl-CoA synthetase
VDTGKCVDASPLLIHDDSRDPAEIVYIGSHSGKFFAICFRTGRVLWEVKLTDRIESSACLSVCGQFVIVGEYLRP